MYRLIEYIRRFARKRFLTIVIILFLNSFVFKHSAVYVALVTWCVFLYDKQ